ncbi:MAG: hypothetical protein NVSMB9_25190 [Isosphaeraceae bacterium]
MCLLIGLIAASVLGAEGTKSSDNAMITYQVRLLEMNGLEWRTSVYSQLQPVARQGTATVWTAPRSLASTLTEKAARVLAVPQVTAYSQARATIYQNKTRNVVREISREADGPVNHASFVGYTPKLENESEGWSAKVAGRKIDQGVLTNVVLDVKEITAVHRVSLSETLEKKGESAQGQGKDQIRAEIQVPEVVRAEVSGEWLIPNEGVLVVSFGPHTVGNPDGKAEVRERLAVVEAGPIKGEGFRLPFAPLRVNFLSPRLIGGENGVEIPMPSPQAPSRALPQALNVQGAPVALPPLPVEQTPPTALPGSAEPCATPQTKSAPVGDPIPSEESPPRRDPQSRRTGYHPERLGKEVPRETVGSVGETETVPRSLVNGSSTGWVPSQRKTFTLPLPFNGHLEIEIKTSPNPSPSANVPCPPEVKAAAK